MHDYEEYKANRRLRVLVVDDIDTMRILVRNNLRAMGFEQIMLAANGREAVELLKKWSCDLVLTDWNMPLMDGLELLQHIRESERHRDVPVVLITAEGDRAQVRNAITAGVSEFLIKPFTFASFQKKVRRVLGGVAPRPSVTATKIDRMETVRSQTDTTPPPVAVSAATATVQAPLNPKDGAPTILAVDDIPDILQLIARILKNDYRVKGVRSGEQALRIARSDDPPHLILLDIMMPDMDGIEVCRQLKEDPLTRDIPIIFLTAKTDAADVIEGLDLGAVDYVTKPTPPAVLKARIRTHLRLSQQQHELREQRAQALENARLREEIERMTRHDIKNPLNALLALARNLAASDNLRPEQQEAVAAMEESAQYVLDMIDHSLALQQMESGTYQLAAEPFDLVDLLSWVAAETRSAFGRLRLDIRPPSDDPVMVCGETLLCHALFANLIRNAAEAAPPGSPIRIDIETGIDLETGDGQIVTHIHNEGAVPMPVREHFFEKYVTHGKTHGTGIGTYSARLMAETQGGRIAMETSDESGTRLSVTLPAA